jgi:formylglycine-generating enzyme required for sulfatase activity
LRAEIIEENLPRQIYIPASQSNRVIQQNPACCAASRSNKSPSQDDDSQARETKLSTEPATEGDDRTVAMVQLDGGTFRMGTDSDIGFPADGEGPTRSVTVAPFYIDKYAVTNAQFLKFIRKTGYTTDAEQYGWSFVFKDFHASKEHALRTVTEAPWWIAVKDANWLHPEGPGSSVLDDRLKHPVVHISWRDAQAYAMWAGKRLPTETEWEYAARGGLETKRYPWGDELVPNGKHRCNIWQGEFPTTNTGADGYLGAAPVNEYDSNGFGLYNVSGNVWEWCADWFSADHHTTDNYSHNNPTGPKNGSERVMRGGSYLCHL